MILASKTYSKPQFRKFFMVWVFALGLFLGVVTPGSFAQSQGEPAESPCDPEYFKSLKSRAWLEAQREITQNQNLIFKPDSVFEYTCFDLYVNELADHAKDMFSETRRWGEVPGISDTSMDDALKSIVGEPLKEYADKNFEESGEGGEKYDLLGGRSGKGSSQGGGIGSDEGDEIDWDEDDQAWEISGTQRNEYNCEIMNQIWEEAKCMDFIHNDENDGFYTFEEYRDDEDKRFLPKRCEQVANNLWETNIKEATGDGDDGTPWEEDEAESLVYVIVNPDQCGTAEAPPIPTGITVRRAEQEPRVFMDCACIMPGCYHKPGSESSCGSCELEP
ncbi:hypothetical protein N9Z27_01860 [Alphaproteobacteria bacterium]|nr:hypothetical protein [Alphaproteobacteria bacterium]